ncbi:VanZ family protein [Kingella negevensis]|uniref:VanZ like family protein n=1 Tax=Kingella negevensis TaxID=1522312 RepID=A0A238HHL5_9NEIS|nr:VanZ family protein [Kingella negevensis]MDK4679643.1 VanZ family protein [Kingella negevensis]MDK4682638.1 VanZ family protein [Kingella negevensis]MDK4684181.1 VanZ family protein [Kingella negevensis]MDK4690835.1 VanZ family protein [Kingella negevensis]MDK4694018.1 VanZ family protein [Kingella negevensis]
MKLPKNKWLVLGVLWFIAGIYSLIFRESTSQTPPPFPHFDKLAHCLLFFAQTWLLAKAWLTESLKVPTRTLFIFGLVYAICSEIAQHLLTKTRQGDPFDALADMIGVSVALYLAISKQKIKN